MGMPLWLLEELYYSPQKTVGEVEIPASINIASGSEKNQ